MHRKLCKVVCPSTDGETGCKVYRNGPSKTFSNFVDQVIEECPLSVSSKYYIPVSLKNPNNPFEVLRSKGLLNIARNAVRTRDCNSEVNINFFTEESRHGEAVKLFTSNHRFKNGKLVYSSTQEVIPDLPRDFEQCVEKCEKRRTYLAIRDDSKPHYETICNKSVRKKLTDIFQDVERQNIIRRYEAAADRRRRYSRSLSPLNVCDTRDRNKERYLHTLRHENIWNKETPFAVLHSRKVSPIRFAYHSANKQESSRSPEKNIFAETTSEVSISSRESLIYISPKKTIKKNSRYDVTYKKTITPPRKTEVRDLFVIPPHTCHKTTSCRSHRTTQWDKSRRFVKISRRKNNWPQRSSEVSIENDTYRLEHVSEHPNREQRLSKSVTYDSRKNNIYKSMNGNGEINSSYSTQPKTTFQKRGENPFKCYSCYEVKPLTFGPTDEDIKPFTVRDRNQDRVDRLKSTKYEKNEKEMYGFRNGRKYEEPNKELIRPTVKKKETFRRVSEEEFDSDNTQHTAPFFPHSNSDSDREAMKENEVSSDSKTSICSVFYNDRGKEYDSTRYKDRKNGSNQEKYNNKERYPKDFEDDYRRRDQEASQANRTTNDTDTKEDQTTVKTRRQINPNKVVHFEDTGKRLSQYFIAGKATLDSEKAFEKDEKVHSKKITFFRCSPQSADRKYRTELLRRNKDRREIIIDKDSLEDRIRETVLEEEYKQVDITKDIVNSEALNDYRKKFVNYSISPIRNNKYKTTEERIYDAYKLAVKINRESSRKLQNVGCEACKIERLLGD